MSTIRPARPEEAGAVTELVATAFREGDSFYKRPNFLDRVCLSEVEEMLRDDGGCFLVAVGGGGGGGTEAGELLGAVYVTYTKPGEAAHLNMVSVPRRNGGRGIGRALVRAAEKHLAEAGASRIEMQVVSSMNARLIEWYKGMGYSCLAGDTPIWWTQVCQEKYAGKIMYRPMGKSLQPGGGGGGHGGPRQIPPVTRPGPNRRRIVTKRRARELRRIERAAGGAPRAGNYYDVSLDGGGGGGGGGGAGGSSSSSSSSSSGMHNNKGIPNKGDGNGSGSSGGTNKRRRRPASNGRGNGRPVSKRRAEKNAAHFRRMRTYVCKEFVQGKCTDGAACQYSHDTKKEPCVHFHLRTGGKGSGCFRGAACLFSHASLEGNDEMMARFQRAKARFEATHDEHPAVKGGAAVFTAKR